MSLRARRLRLADWTVGVGAVALLVFMFFFDWFGGGVSGLPAGSRIAGTTTQTTGWQTFTSSRWIWLATILVGLGSALASAASYRFEGPVQLGQLTAVLGALSSALIVYRIAHHPTANASIGSLRASYGIETGIWLGLLAALAIALGGFAQSRTSAEPEPSFDDRKKTAFSGLIIAPDDSERAP